MIKKYLHTRFRVSDMDKSISFYQDILGMEVVEQKTSPRGSKLVFLKFPDMDCELELCSFPDSGSVHVPEDLVHLAFEVDDLKVCIDKLNAAGIRITEGPLESSNGTRFIFTEDPDKYEIELMHYKN
ncbi:VOC family protein [Nitrospina gracilis]|nr:VOC family protein [Nitrospinaceae bacterium]MBN4077763.1 VOC family protein [Nitrospina gracilis]